ncbi:MAG: hypothetical protein JOY55_12750 [Mycobacterium sp.]|nr:hypothetical protein [Mycobacterium sp.]
MTLFYPDCSNNNWSSTQDLIDFLSQLQPEGFSGMCHKVSQGNYFQDAYWPPCQQWCQQNNLPCIGYHYVTTDDPGAQAQNWLATGGGTNAMFDWESGGGDLDNFWNVVNAFNAVNVNVQIGYCPNWYLNGAGGGGDLSSFAANGILLVSSAYPDGTGYASTIYNAGGGNSGEGWNSYNGGTPSAWQFTDKANIAGQGDVDCNAYRGTDITVLFGTTPPPAAPKAP